MSTIPSVLAPTYACGICRQTFTPKGPPIIGEQKEARLSRVGQMLAKHIAETHKAEHEQIAILSIQIQGWILLDQYKHNDTELATESDKIRNYFRRIIHRPGDNRPVPHISDAVIENQVDGNLNEGMPYAELRETCIKLLKGIRNTLEETPPTA